MASPEKVARRMFSQFLSKADPGAEEIHELEKADTASMSDISEFSSAGGRARADALSAKKRRQIAERAAKARWKKR